MELGKEIEIIKSLLKEDKQKAISLALDISTRLKGSESPTNKGELFHILGATYHDMEIFPKALSWYSQSIEAYKEAQERANEAKILNEIGVINVETARYAEALSYFEKALEIKKELGDKQSLSATYENMAVVYKRQLNYPKAIAAFYESLNISEGLDDYNRMATTYLNIGNTHFVQGDEQSALKMFEQALALKKDSNDFQRIVQLRNNIAVCLQKMGRIDEAITNYKECITISQANNYLSGLRSANNNLGEIYFEQKNYEEAIQYFKICLDTATTANSIADLKVAEQNLGFAELELGNLEQAEKYLLSSLQKFTDTEHTQGLYELHLYLSKLYEKKNDLPKALDHFRLYDELKAKQLNKDNSSIIHELKTKYEVDKKEKENEINRLRNIELKDALEDLTIEKRRSEKLLLNILPEEIAYELKRNGKVKAQYFESVSVLFADIKSFTKHSEALSPDILVGLLDFYFQLFDNIMQQHDIEKIKTIGDAYLCVCGLPNINEAHAVQMVSAAMEMQKTIVAENEKKKANGLPFFEFRFGIHSGAVIAGIVGRTKFEYDIWGDTVNTAARMEQSGEVNQINISATTFELVKEKFRCTPRGKIKAKNKGEMEMYFVEEQIIASTS